MKISLKKVFLIIFITFLIIGITTITINLAVKWTTQKQIITVDEASKLEDVDCIIVLGARVIGNSPSHMLEDRILTGINLYKNKAAPKIIMSGDHGRNDYDEVNAMKQFAINDGVLSEDIFMDHAGFSTYESIYRAKEIFEAKKVIIVTQKYHLHRALYISNKLGIEAYGVEADLRKYQGETYREIREIIARNKDFFKCVFKPKPKYLGESIPVSGNGDITDDKR